MKYPERERKIKITSQNSQKNKKIKKSNNKKGKKQKSKTNSCPRAIRWRPCMIRWRPCVTAKIIFPRLSLAGTKKCHRKVSFWKLPFLAFGYLNDIPIFHPAVATVTVSNYTLPFSPQTNIKRLSQFAPFSLISLQISQTRKGLIWDLPVPNLENHELWKTN